MDQSDEMPVDDIARDILADARLWEALQARTTGKSPRVILFYNSLPKFYFHFWCPALHVCDLCVKSMTVKWFHFKLFWNIHSMVYKHRLKKVVRWATLWHS